MTDIQTAKRKSLKAILGASGISWASPIVYSVVLPAHAVASPPPQLTINSVTISPDPGGNSDARSVSFEGLAISDNIELFEDAAVAVTISTNTDSITLSVTAGGSDGNVFGSIKLENIVINNSTAGNITIKADIVFPSPVCDSVSVSNDIGTTTGSGLLHSVC